MKRIIIAALGLWVAGCSCGEKTGTRAPILEVLNEDGTDRTSVDFGFVQVDVKGVQKVRVRNSGNAVLSISEVVANPTLFGVDDTLPVEIAAGSEGEISATFTPKVADQRITGTITLTTNDTTHATFVLNVAGQGVTAVAKPSPTTLAFGDVYIGEMKTLTLTLTNAGGNALPVTGASITGGPPGVTGSFTAFTNAMIPAGGSAQATVTFAPMVAGALTGGAVQIQIDTAFGGNVTVPITGRATQALPQLCFKFDDMAMEQCTDQITTSVSANFGSLCDNRIYAAGAGACTPANGTRTGKMYLKNTGNVPVPYTVRYTPYPYAGGRCGDAGVVESDFVFSNIAVPDGGLPSELNSASLKLPNAETDPKPWETAPISIAYHAASSCRGEGADQARIIWTRQDPITTMPPRTPSTLLLTLTGQSALPAAKAKGVNIGQPAQPADVPLTSPIPVELVTNEGAAPLTLTSVELWEELPFYGPDGGQTDGGGPGGGLLVQCNPSSPTYDDSDCSKFSWAPGQSPANLLPVTLDGGASPTMPSERIIGRMFVGCLADGGSCPPATTRIHVVAVVNTTDPYAQRVAVPITAYVKFLP